MPTTSCGMCQEQSNQALGLLGHLLCTRTFSFPSLAFLQSASCSVDRTRVGEPVALGSNSLPACAVPEGFHE